MFEPTPRGQSVGQIHWSAALFGNEPVSKLAITLSHKGFWSVDLLVGLNGGGQRRHGLIPACNGLVPQTLQTFNADDPQLPRMRDTPRARKRNQELRAV